MIGILFGIVGAILAIYLEETTTLGFVKSFIVGMTGAVACTVLTILIAIHFNIL